MGWGLQGRLKTGQEPWPWSPHHGAFTLLAAGTGRRDAAGQRKGGTGCCVDKASADPRDLWSWGGPLEPGTGHQASASHTHHWTRAPWGSSAIGKAIPIGAASETPPAAGGCPPFLVEHQALVTPLTHLFKPWATSLSSPTTQKFSSPPCFGFGVSADKTDALMATVHSKADLRDAGTTGG